MPWLLKRAGDKSPQPSVYWYYHLNNGNSYSVESIDDLEVIVTSFSYPCMQPRESTISTFIQLRGNSSSVSFKLTILISIQSKNINSGWFGFKASSPNYSVILWFASLFHFALHPLWLEPCIAIHDTRGSYT